MDKQHATRKSKSSKRKLTKCDICASLDNPENRPEFDGVDGKSKVGIRSVLETETQTETCKDSAHCLKKQQSTNVTKKARSSKGKKKTRRLTNHDIQLVCTWLANEDNRSKVHGVDGRTKPGIKPVVRAKAYRELAEFVNKNHTEGSTSSRSPITGDSMKTRFCHVMKRFRETRKLAEAKSFGLNMNVGTIQLKLENLCPGFKRLEAIFGIPPRPDFGFPPSSVNLEATKGTGVGIFSSAEGRFPLDSKESKADEEMDYGTEGNPVMIETFDSDQDEGSVEKPAPPSVEEKTRRMEDEDGRLQRPHTAEEYKQKLQHVKADQQERATRSQEDKEAERAIAKMNLQAAMMSSNRPLDEMKEILKLM